jgi:hypothetical protein
VSCIIDCKFHDEQTLMVYVKYYFSQQTKIVFFLRFYYKYNCTNSIPTVCLCVVSRVLSSVLLYIINSSKVTYSTNILVCRQSVTSVTMSIHNRAVSKLHFINSISLKLVSFSWFCLVRFQLILNIVID